MLNKLPYFFVLLAAILWGTTGTAQSFAPQSAHPIAIGMARIAIGGLTILLIVSLQRKLTFHNWPIKATIIAALSMGLYQLFFFSGVKLTGIAVGTVIGIGSAPIIAGLMEWIFLRKVPQKAWWSATCLAIIGCLLLFSSNTSIHIDSFGIALAIGAGASFAVYSIVSKEILARQAPEVAVAVVFTLSALILSPCLFFVSLDFLTTTSGLAVALHLGIVATGIAYLLYNKGLLTVPSSTAVTLALAEPLTAALLGVFLVGEHLTIQAWIGVGLLFTGIALLTIMPKKEEV